MSVSFRFSDDSQWPDAIRVRYKHAGGARVTSDNNPKREAPLMIGEARELLTAAGRSLARSGPDGWRELELKISGAGGMTSTSVRATTADGSIDQDCELDDDGDDAAADLRDSMYQEGKGAWYNARPTLDGSGQLSTAFDYDNPLFEGDADSDLLIEDQRLFPRDEAKLPDWHPSRSG